MPFTPIHMGPGLLIKSLLNTSFSLMVFGWTQIVMDIQPLIVLITAEGHLHGFTHTYIGAIVLGIFSAISGKYLSEFFLNLVIENINKVKISWLVAIISALFGSFSHVLLDSIMHADLQPFYPFDLSNPFLQWISTSNLHKFCFYTGLTGSVIWLVVNRKQLKDWPSC